VSAPRVLGSPSAHASQEDWAEAYREARRVKRMIIVAAALIVCALLGLVKCSATADATPDDRQARALEEQARQLRRIADALERCR
jgi:hypothetical protein